jgi:hypothetical protein
VNETGGPAEPDAPTPEPAEPDTSPPEREPDTKPPPEFDPDTPSPETVAEPEPAAELEQPPPAPAEPPLRAYELPTARRVVTYGLELAYGARSELRRASLYIGLLTVALLGPPIVFAVEFVAHFQLVDAESFANLGGDPSAIGIFLGLMFLVYFAFAGWIAVTIDGQLIAIALLAARASDRPYTLREATIRARQVFWRLVRGSFAAGLLAVLIEVILILIFINLVGFTSATSFVASLIASIAVAPFGYLATGVVLGDVGAGEALRRSLRLARARPSIALVVALFTVVTGAIQTFALGAGLDLVFRVGDFLHLGVTGGVLPLVITILGLLAFVMALGSLNFTVAAIVAAPQVAAFLGLTYYSAGLDRARDLPPTAPRFRWITRPMVALVALVALFSGLGIVSTYGSKPDPMVGDLRSLDSKHLVILAGGRLDVVDPASDEDGPLVPSADIVESELAYIYDVPSWLLNEVFDCKSPAVACPPTGRSYTPYSDGALLVDERMGGAPAMSTNDAADWGPVFRFDGFDAAPASAARWSLASDAVITHLANGVRSTHHWVVDGGSWIELPTNARSIWVGSDLLTLIPFRDEFSEHVVSWDMYAAFAPAASGAPASRDTLRGLDGEMIRFVDPPFLRFPEPFAFPTP